jgi:hypothetical protein
MFVEPSTNETFVFFEGLNGVHEKLASGARQVGGIDALALGDALGLGAALGLGDGLALGAALPDGLGLADGPPEGPADGLLDGLLEGDADALGAGGGVGGISRGTDVAVDERAIVWPPRKVDSSGVTRLNWPVTVISIVWSIDATQVAATWAAVVTTVPSHAIEIALAGTDSAELFVSLWIAQMIRFVAGP